MFSNSRWIGVGRRNSTPCKSRSKFHYIGSPLSTHMIFILLHCLLSFVTVTSFAHQRFLCCVVSSSAAISAPHIVSVVRFCGPLGGGGGPSLGDRPQGDGGDCLPWDGEGQEGGRIVTLCAHASCMPTATGLIWLSSTGGPSPRFGYATPPPPPPPCPPGPLSYQRSIATGHTYGGAEGACNIFSFPLPT